MATYYVRNDGGSTVRCTGQADAADPGSGTAQACAYSSIQNAVDAAVGGDVIILKVETHTISATINLPSHSGASYVTIKGQSDASIPAPTLIRQPMASGVTALMPVIATTNTNSDPVFDTASNSAYWRINGCIITDNATIPDGQAGFVYVNLDAGSHYIIDRCVVKPKNYPITVAPYNTNARWGIRANATDVTIQDSDILGMYGLLPGGTAGAGAVDGNGVVCDLGPGNPLNVKRNYIEAWFDHIFLGGTDPPASSTQTLSGTPTLTTATVNSTIGLSVGMIIALQLPWSTDYCKSASNVDCWGNAKVTNISGNNLTFTPLIGVQNGNFHPSHNDTRVLIPSGAEPLVPGKAIWAGQTVVDPTIQQNHFHTPVAFSTWQLANNGNHPKAVIETKICQNLLFDGNYMTGFPNTFGTTSYNQNGGSPWTGIIGATFSNNWNTSFNVGFFIPLADPYYLNTEGRNVVFTNNLCTGPDNGGALSSVTLNWIEAKGGLDWTATHNTVLTGYPTSYVGGTVKSQVMPSLYYNQPTIVLRNNIWGYGDYGLVCDAATPNDCWPSYTEDHNLMALNVNPPNSNPATQLPNSTTAASWAAVLFTGSSATTLNDWKLQAGSPGHNAASDGTDIGVNISTLMTALGATTSTAPSALTGLTKLLGKVTIL